MRIPISLTVYSNLLQSSVLLDAFRQLINLFSDENDYKLRLPSNTYITEKWTLPRELNFGSYESTCEKDAVMSLSITIEPSPYCTEIVYFPFVYCLRFKDYVKISQGCSVKQFARIRSRVCHEMYYQYRHFETAISSDAPLLAF